MMRRIMRSPLCSFEVLETMGVTPRFSVEKEELAKHKQTTTFFFNWGGGVVALGIRAPIPNKQAFHVC